jgi:hypothetical protein
MLDRNSALFPYYVILYGAGIAQQLKWVQHGLDQLGIRILAGERDFSLRQNV